MIAMEGEGRRMWCRPVFRAVHPLHGDDANKLIQWADVAMYLAKEAHWSFEVYSTDRDGYSPARLALASELHQAIDNEDLLVYYQPRWKSRRERGRR